MASGLADLGVMYNAHGKLVTEGIRHWSHIRILGAGEDLARHVGNLEHFRQPITDAQMRQLIKDGQMAAVDLLTGPC